jgi:CspA family cold shock protein
MAIGIVKWFDLQTGHGYIQLHGDDREVFVRISSIEAAGLSTLNEGQLVEFEIEETLGKASAVKLRRPLISRCE